MTSRPIPSNGEDPPPAGGRRLATGEFVAILAMCFASVALAIDAMLPALPLIAAELVPQSPNRAPLIIVAYVLGMGLGTLFVGPLSDAFGRKRVIGAGAVVFCLGAVWASLATGLETLLAARVVMGLGGAAPRVVSLALLRDLYSGRQMARVTSLVMMVFTLVPAVAPLLGAAVLTVAEWRAIFLMLIGFSVLATLWLMLRQPETLPPSARRPLRIPHLWAALREVVSHPSVRGAVLVLGCIFGTLFGTLSSVQQIFDQTFGRAETFPVWFALIAVLGGTSSLVNALLVVRLGMLRMVTAMLRVQLTLSAAMAVMTLGGLLPEALLFPAVVVWIASLFFTLGVTVGNVNALALEPMGHIAGMAASVTSALATVIGALLAVPIGLAFDGTPGPLAMGCAAFCAVALWRILRFERR
jgi:DHA1 family bicyclomycin/chloramphenicol resistance-like MFS transporter